VDSKRPSFFWLALARFAIYIALFVSVAARANAGQTADPAGSILFDRDVRPILSDNCFACHGADPNKRKAKLRLDQSESAVVIKGVIVPGKPEKSEVIKRIFSTNTDEQMPPPASNRHLNSRQKEILTAWIKNGARYQKHWSFIAPTRPPLPAVKRSKWPRNPIDDFILARLESEKLSPTREAPLEKLLRRVSFDLTGLPPTLEQLKHWRSTKDPYGIAVDELLASPHFGERMASDWMDVSRYADTHGFNNDSMRSMWRWRDWVIAAFNQNLPYNRFITEQLAGDLLPKPTLDDRIATAFNRNHVINSEGGIIDEEYRVEYVIDRVQTSSMAWMGLTVGCARCHDHKFDPLTQKEFYQFFTFFNNVDEFGEDGRVANASPILLTPTLQQQKLMGEHRAKMKSAKGIMDHLLQEQDWNSISLNAPLPCSTNSDLLAGSNTLVSLNLSSWNPTNTIISNLAGGKVFQLAGKLAMTNGPLGSKALLFDGTNRLNTETLPKADGKGWTFAAWVRRDQSSEAPLFSTCDFHAPASSDSYGRGMEIRFTKSGALEARVVLRWPAYSGDVVTRETVPIGEWRHVLVTFDGSMSTKGLHIFLDGRECFRDIVHDDLLITPDISGHAIIGTSAETNSTHFIGALADGILTSRHDEPEKMASQTREEVLRFAAETPEGKRSARQTELLRDDWLRRNRPEFAQAEKDFDAARNDLLGLEREAPTTMVMRELSQPRPAFVLFRGQYDQRREQVQPDVPEFLMPFSKSAPRNRLGLAQWLTDARNPLTARVVVNRFWQSVFGTGIVKSAEDFGYQADWPSHPELLDWLAVEFVESGWDVKKLLKLMVASAAYRQDSRSTPDLNERDPENRLLAHGPRRRLTAEMLRDEALALSGLLEDRIGGPPVYPYQPTNFYKGIVVAADLPGTVYKESKGADLYRRSLYTFWKRTVPNPTLATFDAPDREVCVARRLRTNTPLQALALMNDIIRNEAARKLAERMLLEGGSKPESRLNFAFELATGRRMDRGEQKALLNLLQESAAHFKNDSKATDAFLTVGESKPDSKLDRAELAAYADVASLILNLDETITIN
jgi:Protein of unknown function (DUF1553)/Protein of unknown function (DUF1549)/Planctomycete cytochrome C/Concanavalin A-like lectin/glucanases superfamily